MLVFFQICFGVGLAMTVINTILSLVFGIIGAGHDFDFDIDLDIDFDIGCFLPLTPSLIFLFLTVFGGTGMIAYDSLPVPVTIAVALAIAVAVNFVMWKFIVKPLKKISAKEVADENSLIGCKGIIGDTIEADGGFGSVLIVKDGNTIANPAQSSDRSEIKSGAEVVVLEIKNNVYIVERL